MTRRVEPISPATFIVDIGKSEARGRLNIEGEAFEATTLGVAPDTAGSPGGGLKLHRVVSQLWDVLSNERKASPTSVGQIVVGSTSIPGASGRSDFFEATSRIWPGSEILLAEDGVFAHAAALGGPGIVASIGTGTVVTGLSSLGNWQRLDGWGPDLGDRGSATWLGTAGLRSAFAAVDGVSPATALVHEAQKYLGDLNLDLANTLLASPDRVSILAGFAPYVCASEDHDPIASELVDRATAACAATIARMIMNIEETVVAVLGRLGTSDVYHSKLRGQLTQHSIQWVEPTGGMLDLDPATIASAPYYAGCYSQERRG